MSKTTSLHVHHVFLYILLPSLHNYVMKWPNFKFTWKRKWQGDKFYNLCPGLGRGPLSSAPIQIPFFLGNWAPWNNREKNWKDAMSIFSDIFMDVDVVGS